MNIRELFNRSTNSNEDIIQKFIDLLEKERIPYAVIGGIGVNAYCSPVLTADFDCVVEKKSLPLLKKLLKKEGFKIKTHPYTIEVSSLSSDVKIQLQKQEKFQAFLKNARRRKVIGYNLMVASKEDILLSKIDAYLEPTRVSEKRVKDLADIIRLLKTDDSLNKLLPDVIKQKLKEFE